MAKHSAKLLSSRPAKAGLVFVIACLVAAALFVASLLMGGSGLNDGASHTAGSGQSPAEQPSRSSEQDSAQDLQSASSGKESQSASSDLRESSSEADSSTAGASSDAADNGAASKRVSCNVAPKDMSKVKNRKGKVFCFTVAGAASSTKPNLSKDEMSRIEKAVGKIENAGNSVGFVLVDVNTGKGVGYNINQKIYGASSIKASVVAWVLQSYVDKGKAGLGKSYPSGIYNKQGNLTVTGTKKLSALMENTLMHSDNADYLALRGDFELNSYAKWLEKCGVDGSIGLNDTDFPHYSAKQAACMWLNIADYLCDGSKNAKKLDGWLKSTEFSYLRHALRSVEGIEVRNKAGWCAIPPSYYGCCDNGFITVGDDAYVLCIMTDAAGSADYTSGSSKRLMSLAKAAFSVRESLR